MPRKSAQPEQKPFQRSTFVNYELTQDQKERLRKSWMAHPYVSDLLDRCLDSDYKLTVKRDTYHHCWAAWLIPDDPKSENAGYILSGRGKCASTAIAEVLFKHYDVFDGVWPRVESGDDPGTWDDVK